jgi:hypothetical protein
MQMTSKRSKFDGERGSTPEVILDFEYDNKNGGLLFVIIENVSLSSAYNISIKFDHEIIGLQGEKKITDMEIFRSLKFLPPGKKIRIFIDTFFSYLIRKQPLAVGTTILYSNKYKQRFRDLIKHDISIYKDIVDVE